MKGLIVSIFCLFILMIPCAVAYTPHYIAKNQYNGGWSIWSPWMSFDDNFTAMDLCELTINGIKINDDLFVICRLNSSSMRYESYVRGDGEEYNFKLQAGEGYWLWIWDWSTREGYIDEAFQWGPNHAAPVNYTLYAGWNIVGRCGPYPSYLGSKAGNPIDAKNFCSRYVRGAGEIIISKMIRTGETAHWTSYIYPENYNNFRLQIFEGFYIWVNSNAWLSFPQRTMMAEEIYYDWVSEPIESIPGILPDPGLIPDPVSGDV